MTYNPQQRKAKERFKLAVRLEREYEKSLKAIVKQIDRLVRDMVHDKMSESELKAAQADLTAMLHNYSGTIKPWAKSVAAKMLAKIAKTDESEWIKLGRQMNRALHKELETAPTGDMLRTFLAEQVSLITSLPKEAGDRVHEMTLKGITTGERADSIARKILETGSVTMSRARCIARTEVARTAAGLTMSRSKHVGSTHYYWRTCSDGDVRESHKHMDGRIIEFANPPEVEPGLFHHAGMIYNCRCYMSPIMDWEMSKINKL